MNSDMDNNSEATYRRLLSWLIDPAVDASADSGRDMAMDSDEPLDPFDLELNLASSDLDEADALREPLNLGDLPTVQNRFHALLKRRLKAEIECRPPLFPWETELTDYEPTALHEEIQPQWVPPLRLWMPQLASLSMPVALPEPVLAQLLEACTEAVRSPLQQGAKLVRAVSSLFPDQSSSLNQLAGMVLLYPSRSTQMEQLFTSSYEQANQNQQMALSLLAANEIIKALTLQVSATSTRVERQWQTEAGAIALQVEYTTEQVPKLRVLGSLPKGGSLSIQLAQASATAHRSYPGYVSVEVFDFQPHQTYPLEIRLLEMEQEPLVFGISVN